MRISTPEFILVTGGRDLQDQKLVNYALDTYLKRITATPYKRIVVVQGGCKTGVDRFAREWCRRRDQACVSVPAQWRVAGTAAGPIRNREMLVWFSQITEVAAFPGGRGTADMVSAAEEFMMPVAQWTEIPAEDDDGL